MLNNKVEEEIEPNKKIQKIKIRLLQNNTFSKNQIKKITRVKNNTFTFTTCIQGFRNIVIKSKPKLEIYAQLCTLFN